jgi:hypothetical protein
MARSGGWCWGSGGHGEREQAGEDRLDGVGPGPVGWEVEPASPAAAGEGGRGVEDAVLQGGWFGAGEVVVAAEQAEPGDQVAGDGLGAVPGGVDGEVLGGRPVGAGVVADPEVVFDAGVDAVAGVEPGGDFVWVLGGLCRPGVGGEGFVAPAGGAGL